MTKNALVVDLDGTLLHPEPEAIAVWGRAAFRYLSQRSAELLALISRELPIIIASGRSAASVGRLVCQLPEVRFSGFVTENGFISRPEIQTSDDDRCEWRELHGLLPDWTRLAGYELCLGLIPPETVRNPVGILQEKMQKLGKTGFIYAEQRKIFIYPSAPNKLPGVRALGFEPFLVFGNDINDLQIIEAGHHVATVQNAQEAVKTVVQHKGGYCSPFESHPASEDVLEWVYSTFC